MGKKTKATSLNKSGDHALETEVAKKYSELRSEGNQHFAKKEYLKAIDLYDQAAKLLPDIAPEKADVVSNKAACYLQMKRWKDAVKECSNALTLQPSHNKALQRRAKAYENLALFKQALTDIQAYNKSDSSSDESREMEKRLREQVSGRKAGAGVGINGAARGAASTGPRTSARPSQPYYITAKCTFGGETKLVHTPPTVSYAEFYGMVKAKFPQATPFVLKYADKEGDLVTLTSRHDIQAAIQELLVEYQRTLGPHGPRLGQQMLPSLRIVVAKVASEAEVPQPPAEEEAERAAAARVPRESTEKPRQPEEKQEVLEIDQWIIDFAQLFKDFANFDPDKHVELSNAGWDRVSEAMQETLSCEEAEPLWAAACEKFHEVSANGLLSWGNVSQCRANKLLESAAAKGEAAHSVKDKVFEYYAAAEAKYRESAVLKPDYFEAAVSLAQLDFERAKTVAGLAVQFIKAPPADESIDPAELEKLNAEYSAAALAATRSALARVTVDAVDTAEPFLKEARDKFKLAAEVAAKSMAAQKASADAVAAATAKAGKAANGMGEHADEAADGAKGDDGKPEEKEEEKAGEPKEDKATPTLQDYSPVAQCDIMLGNILYEWSQVLAAVERPWRPLLDEALALFRGAGCSDADVRGALKNHTCADQLDLGPDEAEEAKVEVKEEKKPAEEAAKGAKGLPSLGLKKKKKAADATPAATA